MPPDRKRGKIPWEEIRAKFVGDPTISQAELAREFNVKPQNLNRRATKENWEADRSEHQEAMRAQVIADIQELKGEVVVSQCLELLKDLAECRKAIIAGFLKGLGGEAEDVEVIESVRVIGDEDSPASGAKQHRIRDAKRTKRKIRPDGRFAEMLIRTEAELIQALAGVAGGHGGALVEIAIGGE